MNFRNLVVPSAGGGGAQTLQTQSRFNLTLSGNSTSAGAGYILVSSGVLTLAGGNNVTLSQNGNAITISGAAAGGAQTAISGISASDTLFTSGSVRFTGSNMVTVKTDTGQLVIIDATQTVQTQNMVAVIGSGANGNGTFSSGTLSIKAGNNITLSTGANVISIHGVSSQTVQSQNFVAVIGSGANGNGTFTSGTLSLKVGADITLSTGANVVSIYGNSTQSVQTQMTGLTAGLSNIGNTAGDTILVSQRIVFAGGNNITLSGSSNGNSLTITISGAAAGGAQTAISGISASDTLYTSGTVKFTGSNMITVKSGAAQLVIIDATQTNQSAIKGWGASNTGNTAGNTGLSTGIDWVIAGSNNITISQSTVGGGPNTIWVSGPTVGGAQTGISGIIVSNATYTSGTVSFSNAGNITISSSVNGASQYIVLSGNAAQTNQSAIKGFGVSNTGQTAGNTGLSTGIDWVLAGSSLITLSQSTAGGGPNTVWIQHPAWLTTQSAQSVSAANGAYAFTNISFSNANGVSFATSAGSAIVGSINQSLTMYATSNTTQSTTGTAAFSSLIFNGAGGMSVGISGGSVVVSAPATSSLVGTNGLSVSVNGSTLSVSLRENSIYKYFWGAAAAGTAQANSSVSIQPFFLECPLAFSNILLAASVNVGTAANASSAYVDISASVVIYSRNVSTLSSMASFNNNFTQSFSSNATGTITGVQGLSLTGAATTLTQGEYYMAVHFSTNNTATGGANTTALGNTVSMILAQPPNSAANLVKVWGAQTNNSLGLVGGQGILSTGATLATIGFSAYTMTGANGILAPVAFELRNQTWWG